MSPKTQQNQGLRHVPMLKQKKQQDSIAGLSPDDDIGLPSEEPSKPGKPMK